MPAPLAVSRVHHIARETADVPRSIAFYRDVLGFRAIQRPQFSFAGAWLFGHGVQIHVIEGAAHDRPPAISTKADHVAFYADDMAAVERGLVEHGIEFRRNVQQHTGLVQLFFHDPDGNHIEIGTYPPTPPFV